MNEMHLQRERSSIHGMFGWRMEMILNHPTRLWIEGRAERQGCDRGYCNLDSMSVIEQFRLWDGNIGRGQIQAPVKEDPCALKEKEKNEKEKKEKKEAGSHPYIDIDGTLSGAIVTVTTPRSLVLIIPREGSLGNVFLTNPSGIFSG